MELTSSSFRWLQIYPSNGNLNQLGWDNSGLTGEERNDNKFTSKEIAIQWLSKRKSEGKMKHMYTLIEVFK